ncbi:MAG TPA: response regulator [Candidatus Saccharimonadales bacterium]|nr:response regulator [Candidatus Saccharimonadales bacterium]
MKILIIDDDAFFRKFYAAKLEETGYEVVVAIDGEEGLEKIAKEAPNLILLDLIMPKKNGFEVMQDIAKNKNIKLCPIIIFSTLDQEHDIAEAKELGAVDYINKESSDWESTLAKISSYMPH